MLGQLGYISYGNSQYFCALHTLEPFAEPARRGGVAFRISCEFFGTGQLSPLFNRHAGQDQHPRSQTAVPDGLLAGKPAPVAPASGVALFRAAATRKRAVVGPGQLPVPKP